MLELRTLRPGDEERLEAYLVPRTATSLFLRSNVRAAGLEDQGRPYEGTYVGAFADGELAGVAAHCWNGMLIVSAERHVEELARAAVARTGRDLAGLLGPWDQVEAARAALDAADRPTTMSSREDLFWLELAELHVPPALASGEVVLRPTVDADFELATAWRVDYSQETLGLAPGDELRRHARTTIEWLQAEGNQFLLESRDGRPLAYTAFNARLPDCVQVGGVWTPPELRGQGHGRSAVAGSLLLARDAGATSSVLFTSEGNEPAQRAYRALGYRRIGDYGLVIFA